MIKDNKRIEPYRVIHREYGPGYGNNGMFVIPYVDGRPLTVIASDGMMWDHVSVSTKKRPPTWNEMAFIKRMFFAEDEPAFQIYPKEEYYRNCHPYCLHWWRHQAIGFPLPPAIMVAPG